MSRPVITGAFYFMACSVNREDKPNPALRLVTRDGTVLPARSGETHCKRITFFYSLKMFRSFFACLRTSTPSR